MLFCFANISDEILLHVLGYSFCTEHLILVHFLPNAVAIKSIKIYLRKRCSALALKMLMKLKAELLYNTNYNSKIQI